MYDVFCPRHDARVLLGPRTILALREIDGGLAIEYRCYCGHHGVEWMRAPRHVGAVA